MDIILKPKVKWRGQLLHKKILTIMLGAQRKGKGKREKEIKVED